VVESVTRIHRESAGDCPALVLLRGLGGDRGFWAGETPAWTADFVGGIAGASLCTFGGAGHLVDVEDPDRFLGEVRTFLLGRRELR
jgi:hypothetical protein